MTRHRSSRSLQRFEPWACAECGAASLWSTPIGEQQRLDVFRCDVCRRDTEHRRVLPRTGA